VSPRAASTKWLGSHLLTAKRERWPNGSANLADGGTHAS